jgi:hypothetical protein
MFILANFLCSAEHEPEYCLGNLEELRAGTVTNETLVVTNFLRT